MTMKTETKKLSSDFWVGLFSPAIFFAIFVVCAPVVILKVFVFTKLWDWYVVPAFGVQPLRLVYAFGISLLINFLLPHDTSNTKKLHEAALQTAIGAIVALGVGWFGTLFI